MCVWKKRYIEFLATENKSETNIQKRLKMYTASTPLIKSTVSRWASVTAGFQKGQEELSDACRLVLCFLGGAAEVVILVDIMLRFKPLTQIYTSSS